MKTKDIKKGISLIVLIITIVVIIILAAVVILTLSKNNPIESAKEARFKEDVRTFQDELALTVSKQYTTAGGHRDEKITISDFAEIREYIPSFSEKYSGKFIIQDDELRCTKQLDEKEKEYADSLNLNNIKTGAEIVENDPKNMYGERITNYSSNGVSDWKIFYSDGNNIYIITSEYMNIDKLPKKNGKSPQNMDNNCPQAATFTNVLSEYTGTNDITDERIKKLNFDYFITNNYSSEYINIKAVAYMLDIEIWKEFAKGKEAEYAIGGPTIEMFMKSYSNKYNVNYTTKTVNINGYYISEDGGENWDHVNSEVLNKSDSLYVLPESNLILESGNKSGAKAMWLSSPAGYNNTGIRNATFRGLVHHANYDVANHGFRPIVCLKSDAILKKVYGGYEIE